MRRRPVHRLFVFCLLLFSRLAFAEEAERLLVTATKVPVAEKEVGSSFTVLTEGDIQNGQSTALVDALRSVPGLDVTQSGGPGKLSSVFLRGSKDGQLLVLVDGVEMNDPISPSRGFDFATLEVDNIERVEILRGPQSPLYGSDASGGVIQIFTKKGKGDPKCTLSLEGGSFATHKEQAGVMGGTEDVSYSFTASEISSDGFSVADEKFGNTENDGYKNKTLSGRVSLFEKSPFQLRSSFRYNDLKTDVDNGGGAFMDDPNHVSTEKQRFWTLGAKGKLWEDRLEESLQFTYGAHDRRDVNPTDPANPFSVDSTYRGATWKVDWQNTLYANEKHTLVLGVDSEQDSGKSDYTSLSSFGIFSDRFSRETARTSGVYGQDQITLNAQWFATAGLRVDNHETFGTETTGRLASSLLLPEEVQLKASLGTGFKAPTLFQLFSTYGDLDLNPEKSLGMDLGVEKKFADSGSAGVTYFHNDFKELIDFDFATSRYNNVSKATTQGLECTAAWEVLKNLTLKGSYTYTDTEDKSTGDTLLRRPKHKGSLEATWRAWDEKISLHAELDYVGRRDDLDFSVFPSAKMTLPNHTLTQFSGSLQVTEHVQIFGRLQNVFDKEYEEVLGFGTEVRSLYLGTRIVLG